MVQQKSRGGRPRRQPTPGERVPLGLRVTPELKRQLDDAAERSGRSQSQEAEMRLDRSFRQEDSLPELLGLAFGREVAGLLLALGKAMQLAGLGAELARVYPSGPIFNDKATRYFALAWPQSRRAHAQARRAADIVLDGLWPSAPPEQVQDGIQVGTDQLAQVVVDMAKGRHRELIESDPLMARARDFLKSIIKRSRPSRKDHDLQAKGDGQ